LQIIISYSIIHSLTPSLNLSSSLLRRQRASEQKQHQQIEELQRKESKSRSREASERERESIRSKLVTQELLLQSTRNTLLVASLSAISNAASNSQIAPGFDSYSGLGDGLGVSIFNPQEGLRDFARALGKALTETLCSADGVNSDCGPVIIKIDGAGAGVAVRSAVGAGDEDGDGEFRDEGYGNHRYDQLAGDMYREGGAEFRDVMLCFSFFFNQLLCILFEIACLSLCSRIEITVRWLNYRFLTRHNH
jgi:hypothetical protein